LTLNPIGEIDVPLDDPMLQRCATQRLVELLAMAAACRRFMEGITADLSQSWQTHDGPPTGPFQPEAVALHQPALDTYRQFNEMLRTRDFTGAPGFLDTFTQMVGLLHASRPAEFSSVIAANLAAHKPDPQCAVLRARILGDNDAFLRPLLNLLDEAGERLQTIAEA
jgi:hypothetical protein